MTGETSAVRVACEKLFGKLVMLKKECNSSEPDKTEGSKIDSDDY